MKKNLFCCYVESKCCECKKGEMHMHTLFSALIYRSSFHTVDSVEKKTAAKTAHGGNVVHNVCLIMDM